jgi:DNA topoisomerase VI subunit B
VFRAPDDITLDRATFTTSRLLEFFSEKELAMQIGHPRRLWPVVLLKELIDNALDACEQAGVPPQIAVAIRANGLWVRDNGPGIPGEVVEQSLDYTVRVSNKAHYVSPTRGQLGNALKCAWAAPFVVDGEYGLAVVDAAGVRHRIEISLDRIAQKPNLRRTEGLSLVKNGTLIGLRWPEIACSLGTVQSQDFYNALRLLRSYAAFNPHAAFVLRNSRGLRRCWAATEPDWKKWLPSSPTSAHWYTDERFASLIAAYLTQERSGGRSRTVREFVSEFDGLSSTAKQKGVLEVAGLSKATLQDLASDGEIDTDAVSRLLVAMQECSRPVKAKRLGVLGEEHCRNHLTRRCGVDQESVRYRRVVAGDGDLPFVLEVAFGVKADDRANRREVYVGVNWSPALQSPFYQLPYLLGEMRLDNHDPVVLLVHLASPRLDYTDRGKSRLTLPSDVATALDKCVTGVAGGWKKAKRQADREDRVQERDLERLRKANRQREVSIKEAAYQVMEEAYMKASDNNTLPANARQIMYAARPLVLERTNGKCWKKSSYFTQRLLVDFVNANPELTADWDVVYDARGALREPHTGHHVPLGTVKVRDYVESWTSTIGADPDARPRFAHRCTTAGPANRYRFALFVEKEGFDALLDRAEIAGRYDLAMMSTKGMSVTAARQLVERLSEAGVTVLVLHDFDKSGFSILHTLAASNGRYRYRSTPRVIDLGLRLGDVREMDLASEDVDYPGKQDPRANLRSSGATEDECHFLVRRRPSGGWTGQRVELNAMTSSQFVAFLERKLAEAGVQKMVPEKAPLESAYRQAVRLRRIERAVEETLRHADQDDPGPPPADLAERVQAMIEGTTLPWDAAVWQIAEQCAVDGSSSRRPKSRGGNL